MVLCAALIRLHRLCILSFRGCVVMCVCVCGISERKSRSRSTVAEDDYFPSFLTAAPSGGANGEKAQESASLTANQSSLDFAWAQKSRLRRSFAENLAMAHRDAQDVDMHDSPFQFHDDADMDNAMDRMYVRKRKAHGAASSSNGRLSAADPFDDDCPPPPTASLSDPASFLTEPTSLEPEHVPAPAPRRSLLGNLSYTPGDADDEWAHSKQYWVTVYGFPTSSKAFILREFQALGEVISYNSGAGNWLHVRYSTRLQAETALSYDGKRLASAIMIGVKRCSLADLDGASDEPEPSPFARTSPTYVGSDDVQVDPMDADIMLPPRRRQDVCSRLLNYLFKW
ncbi:TPA: hypothetical protein N0F65_012098 [Lagenidium giganteum]|uniref:RRM Nup35-type domain-containing protein n=1 Tax=Lagenidium giganteum TaxID=4803 RepID=A0AAV2YUA7_9STRA|nr:TPA: hypothetical protein N0F65_012098 [Lagenidium giganteum]